MEIEKIVLRTYWLKFFILDLDKKKGLCPTLLEP